MDECAFRPNSSIHRPSDNEFRGQQQNRSLELGSSSSMSGAHQAAENALLPTSQGLRSSFHERLMAAILYFINMAADTSVLIQVWVPVSVDGDRIALTTVRQPHLYDPGSAHLGNYRVLSETFMLSADEGSMDGQGLPGRVYLKKAAEWSPDVRLFRKDECPRLSHALELNIQGSIALPVFANESGQDCLGVVEIVTTTPKLTCRPEVETICLALQAVNLRSSEILTTAIEEGGNESQTPDLTEISAIINTICDEYGLPLGQTWALDHNSLCATTVGMACYVRDQVSGFHIACTEQQLRRGQGVVGKAFETNGPCYSANIAEDSKAEYPLSHHAKLFGLRGAVAVQLQCLHPTPKAYAVEFFLPVEFQGPEIMFLRRIMKSFGAMLPASLRFRNGFPTSLDGTPTNWGNIAESSRRARHNPTSCRMYNEAEKGKETLMISFGGNVKDKFSTSPGPMMQDSTGLRARGKRVAGNETIRDLEHILSDGAPYPDLFAQLLQNPRFRQAVTHPELLQLLSTDEILQQICCLSQILLSRRSK